MKIAPRYITIVKSDTYELPEGVVHVTVSNEGESQVSLDDAVMLEPGDSYALPDVAGATIKHEFNVKLTNATGAGYGSKFRVTFRMMMIVE